MAQTLERSEQLKLGPTTHIIIMKNKQPPHSLRLQRSNHTSNFGQFHWGSHIYTFYFLGVSLLRSNEFGFGPIFPTLNIRNLGIISDSPSLVPKK